MLVPESTSSFWILARKHFPCSPVLRPRRTFPRHRYIVLGLSDGSTRGGHLLNGIVRPTLEVVVTETPAHLRRKKKVDLGIALIDLDADRR
jgi:hypothetical protein